MFSPSLHIPPYVAQEKKGEQNKTNRRLIYSNVVVQTAGGVKTLSQRLDYHTKEEEELPECAETPVVTFS